MDQGIVDQDNLVEKPRPIPAASVENNETVSFLVVYLILTSINYLKKLLSSCIPSYHTKTKNSKTLYMQFAQRAILNFNCLVHASPYISMLYAGVFCLVS